MRRVLRTSVKRKPRVCFFCEKALIPNYKDVGVLSNFLSQRGKILPKKYSGVCSKHQRRLSNAVKRARIMALL